MASKAPDPTGKMTSGGSPLHVVIGGDICPKGRVLPAFLRGDAAALFGDLSAFLRDADLTVVNLEAPLYRTATPINKNGPVFGAPAEAVAGIASAGIDCVSLANNHSMDHGAEGLVSTLEACAAAGVATVGAGRDLAAAGRPYLVERNGYTIGIIALADIEFSIAGRRTPGANPCDPITLTRSIREARERADILIVLLHAGYQYYPYPTPVLQRLARFAVDEGADVVVCQHSHCAGAIEEVDGVPVVYGQGNLVSDAHPRRRPEAWHEGFLLRLGWNGARRCTYEIIPYRQCDELPGARRMHGEDERRFRDDIAARSCGIGDPERVDELWRAYVVRRKTFYFSILRGRGRWARRLGRLIPGLAGRYSDRSMAALLNVVSCEAHREALQTILEEACRANPRGEEGRSS